MNYKGYQIIDNGLFIKVIKNHEEILKIKRFCCDKNKPLTEEDLKNVFDLILLPNIEERTK